MDNPMQAELERLLDEVMSMFKQLDSFKLEGRELLRSKKLRARYDEVRTKQLRELGELDRLKLKASTPREAFRCASRFRALLKRHTKQLSGIMDQLINLMRSNLRGSPKKKR